MKKSPIRKLFINNLVALNDQLWFFLFAEQELVRRLEDFGGAAKTLFTSDMFAQNEYASRIHVKLEKLPGFQNKNQTFTFGAYFSTSYEVASEYYDSALKILIQNRPDSYLNVTKDARKGTPLPIEWAYYETLRASKYVLPAVEIIQTLNYMRLRRNIFIHMSDELSPAFEELLVNDGANLNSYWGKTVSELDFSSKDVFRFRKDETIELLKLLRISIEELDKSLVESLNRESGLKKFISDEFNKKPFRVSSQSSKEFAKKIKKMAHMEYGLDCTLNEVLVAVDEIIGDSRLMP